MQALDRHLGSGDEALLSTAFSYMRKAADDKQDGRLLLYQLRCTLVPVIFQTG